LPFRPYTHRGREISSLDRRGIALEVIQEALEAVVFGVLSWTTASEGWEGSETHSPVLAIVSSLLLAGFCLDRLAMICDLVSLLSQLKDRGMAPGVKDEEDDNERGPVYSLQDDDEMMVIDARSLSLVENETPVYTVLLDLSAPCGRRERRWLLLNGATGSLTDAAVFLRKIRHKGVIDLSNWTDISSLKGTHRLMMENAMGIGKRDREPHRHRPVHPISNNLSMLLEGDCAGIIRVPHPAEENGYLWIVMLTLSDGAMLRHIVPFDSVENATNLVKLMAKGSAFVTDDFLDVTEEMASVEIDRSDEVEIDEDGNPISIH